MTKPKQRGFTLIELMIVVAIIAILAAIAVPKYENYVVPSKVTEGLSLASSAQTAVAETAQSGGGLSGITASGNETGWTPPDSTDYVDSVNIGDGGVISVTYTDEAENIELTLTPKEQDAGEITWECTVAKTDNYQYVPKKCRNGGANNQTTPNTG